MYRKIKSFFYNSIIFMVLFYNFCVWTVKQNAMDESLFYNLHENLIAHMDNIFRLFFYLLMFLFSLFLIRKNKKTIVIFSIILFWFMIITHRKIFVTEIISLFILQAIIDGYYLFNERSFKKIHCIFVLGVLIQLSLFSAFNRRVLSLIDPNLTAYKLFLFFMLLDQLNLKISKIIILICGLQTLSRNYLLGILCYFGLKIKLLKKIASKFIRKVCMNNELIVAVLIFALTMLVAWIFLKFATLKVSYENDIGRIVTLADDSNKLRFEGYFDYMKILFKNSTLRIFGMEQDLFVKLPGMFHNPHNVILYIMSIFGLYIGIGLYIFINRVLFEKKASEYLEILIPWMVYISFLFGYYNGMPILLVGVVVAVFKYKREKLNEIERSTK